MDIKALYSLLLCSELVRQARAHGWLWCFNLDAPSAFADMRQHESRLEELRRDEKRLMGLLADKGAGPQRVGPGVLQAMLTLQDTGT